MCDLYFEDPYFSVEYVSKFDKSRNIVYIFVGIVKDNVEVILKKLENRESIHSNELKILKDQFKSELNYWIKIVKQEKKKIKFVQSRIMYDDSLNEVKQKIFIHCSQHEDDWYILPQNMEIWVKDEKDKSHIFGYKYENMVPHMDVSFELTREYQYDMYNENSINNIRDKNKRMIESSDNYTLLYDLLKNIKTKDNALHLYLSDAYDEYQQLMKTKKYEKSAIISKYLKNYFPVAIYDIQLKEMSSKYLLIKDDMVNHDFVIDNLFHYEFDKSRFQSCYFNNFILNVNGVDGNVMNDMMTGGNKVKIMKMKAQSSDSKNSVNSNSVNNSGSVSKSLQNKILEKINGKKNMIKNMNTSNITNYEFIDLYQIFEYLRTRKIGKKTPFIKYNDYGFQNPFVLISKSAVDQNLINKQLLLSQWTNPQVPVKKFNGLQVKRYIKDMNPSNSPLFSTLYLYKYGRINLSVAFKSENKASFGDINECIMNCKDFVDDINRNILDYRISRSVDIDRKIAAPYSELDKNGGLKLSDNCVIAYMNYFIEYSGGENIDLKDLYEFCKLFPNFLSINPNKSLGLNSIQLRYNRVSGFANLDEIMEKIDNLKNKGIKDGLIIKFLEKEFGKSTEECKKYIVEYKKKYSHIQSSSSDSTNKLGFVIQITKNSINIRGVRNMRHIYDTYRFITLFLSLYLNRNELKSNPTFKRLLFSRNTEKSLNSTTLFEGLTEIKQDFTFEDLDLDIDMGDQALLDTGMMEDEGVEEKDKSESKSCALNSGSSSVQLTVGNRLLAGNEEISTDVQLSCDDAILELDTCEDFCNDAKYFIRRLQRHDKKLFYDKRERLKGKVKYEKYTKYSKSCQKVRQPVVLAYNPDDGLAKDSNMEIKRSSYTYAIKYGSDPDKPNWYICPEVWCPYCRIPIPMADIDQKLVRKRKTAGSGGVCITGVCPFGDHQIFIRGNKDPYPGFQDNQTEEGLCLPCCFGKRQDDPKYGAYKTYQKCLGIDINNNGGNEDVIYVLGKSIPLERNRFGILNGRMEMVLNSNIPTGYLGVQKGYLRRGIKHENHNSFLSAITNIFSCDQENPRSVDDMKQYIVDKIDDKLFRSLYGGNLINVFYDPHKNITPLQNYKNYLLSKNTDIDHTYLWDLIQRPKIISEHGINLFIFENDLLCPLGENVTEFYDKVRKTIILVKHKQYYEPIYYVEGTGKQAQVQCVFENNIPEISKLFEIAYDGCKSYHRIDWKSVVYDSLVANNVKNVNKETIIIDYGISLYDTLKELLTAVKISKTLDVSYLPKLQYVDKSNKVFGVELTNKLFVPVRPSKLIVDIPNFDYKMIEDYSEVSLLSFDKTVQLLEAIVKNTNIPVKPLGTISDINDKYVVGILTEKNRVICVEKCVLKEKKSKLKNLSTKFYSDIDMFIHDNVHLVDERIIFMNKRKYEDETYIRLRFELSRYLQDHSKEKSELLMVIHSDERNIDKKRMNVDRILAPIFEKLISVQKQNIDYDFYELPNHRIPCGLRSVKSKDRNSSSSSKSNSNKKEIVFDCSEDPHCVVDRNDCKLHVNEYNLLDQKKRNLNIYIPMIVEELIRFTLKRNEILNDHIPSIINRERVIENPQKYYIMNTTDPMAIIQKVESIFLDKEGLYLDRRPLVDMITTQDVVLPKNKYTLVNRSRLLSNMNEIPEVWSKILGNQFILILHPSNSKNLFTIFDLLINEFKYKNNSNSVMNNVELLNVKMLKEKMIEFMENSKHHILFQKLEKKLELNGAIQNNMIQNENKSNSTSSSSKSYAHKEYIVNLYKNMDPKYFRNVNDFTSLKYKILSDEYEGNDLDIGILSHILKINFILLNKVKKNIDNIALMYGNESTDFYTDYVLLLRNNNLDKYKYQWFQVKNKGLIHKEKDYSERFLREVLEKIQ